MLTQKSKDLKGLLKRLEQLEGPLKVAAKESDVVLKRFRILQSVSQSLYDELDKLSKKSPSHPLSDLALASVNEVIQEAKEVLSEDPWAIKAKQFVPAGDNPEHRDAVLILGQLRAALARTQSTTESR